MIFKRRETPSLTERLRALVAPRKGWRRGFKYIGKRVQRLPDTPHRIALGFACGAFASFSPFFTLHLFVAMLVAWIIRGNLLAAAFGTVVGNPITFPLIAAICLRTGNWLLGRDDGVDNLDQLSWSFVTEQPLAFFESIFTPYLVGGIAPGVLAGAGFYFMLRPMVGSFQKRRRDTLAERARSLIQRRPAARPTRRALGRSVASSAPPEQASGPAQDGADPSGASQRRSGLGGAAGESDAEPPSGSSGGAEGGEADPAAPAGWAERQAS